MSTKLSNPNSVTLREFLLIKASRFSLQLLGAMLAFSAALLVCVLWYENSIVHREIAGWLEKNQPRIEQAIFLENTLGVDGMLEELGRVDSRIDSVRIQKVDGVTQLASFGDLPSSTCGWFNQGKTGLHTDLLHGRVCYRGELTFAEHHYGYIQLTARYNLFSLSINAFGGLALCLLFFGLVNWAARSLITELNKSILTPLSFIAQTMQHRPEDIATITGVTPDQNAFASAPREILDLVESYNDLVVRIRDLGTCDRERVSLLSYEQLAKQVVHDIRSPLTALRMFSGVARELPDDQRNLLRSAVQRIEEILRSLHVQPKEIAPSPEAEKNDRVEAIADLVGTLILEKRVEYKNHGNVTIDTDLEKAYGLFAKLDASSFKRQLSNLINNAVESSPNGGTVSVCVKSEANEIAITVRDHGCGIPDSVLSRLGKEAISFGKSKDGASGQGIGVLQAHKFTESLGGRMKIESVVGQGTSVTLILPKVQAPPWFPHSLNITQGSRVVMVDDDPSIHEVWRQRFKFGETEKDLQLLHFYSPDDFTKWHEGQPKFADDKTTYLIDYEFKGSQTTGIDLIDQMGDSTKNVLLVSSQDDDAVIRRRIVRRGLRFLPKSLATFVPTR